MDEQEFPREYEAFQDKPIRVYATTEFPENQGTSDWQGYGIRVRSDNYSKYSELVQRIQDGNKVKAIVRGRLKRENLQTIQLEEIRYTARTTGESMGLSDGNSTFQRNPRLISIRKDDIAYIEEIDIPENWV